MNKPFIAIEGPIGVGKSSLAHRLSKTFGFWREGNCWWKSISIWFLWWYRKMEFSNWNVLLCNRYKQFQDVTQLNQGVVSDYHIHKNKIFAKNTLSSVEFQKFSKIYDILTEDMIMPNMIIFLDADLDVLKSRIAKRNRSFEHQIEDEYLLKLKRLSWILWVLTK